MGTSKRTMVKEAVPATGAKSLEVVAKADPKAWLAASRDLVSCTRAASEYLFSALAVNSESPLEKLLTVNFDAEQIWQQIDLQATPTLNKIRKSLRKLEKTPPNKLFQFKSERKSTQHGLVKEGKQELVADEDLEDNESDDLDSEEISGSDDGKEGADDSDNEDGVEGGSKSEEEYSDYDEEEKKAVEDKFLKLSDMEKFLDRADAEDAGIAEDSSQDDEDDGEDEEDDDDDEEDLEMDEAFDFSARLADKDDGENTWGPKYSDFIGNSKKQKPKSSKKQDSDDEPEDDDLEDDDEDEEHEEPGAVVTDRQIVPAEDRKLSAHERQLEKTKRRIEQLEKSNLETKDWTMQGEVMAV